MVALRGITKRFSDLTAVDDVDLDLVPGEVHALVGENGAGKSTLMNCLFGLERPDRGAILVAGREVEIDSPRTARSLGIGMVHQHFKLVPSLSVADNVFLGHERMRAAGVVDRAGQREELARLAERYGLAVEPDAPVRSLSVGAQQRVEILRALSEDVRALVLDEPTGVLTPQEAERLFDTLRGLVEGGLAVVLISHRLAEVRRVAARVTVMRGGRRITTVAMGEVDEHALAELIVGRELARAAEHERERGSPGAVRLAVRGLVARDGRGSEPVRGVDLDVHAGEIVGLVGIAGNGQTELVEAITGLRRPAAGSVRVGDAETTGERPGAARRAGLAHVPEDRMARGVSLWSPVSENLVAGFLDDPELGRPLLRPSRIQRLVRRLVERFDVRTARLGTLARRLSGGNMQKVVLARELSREPGVVVCAEPTRGLDVAAAEFVHRRLVEHRDRGAAVLLVSTEIPEVLGVADRVVVMQGGRIVRDFGDGRPSEHEVGRAMLGMQG